MQNDNTYNVLFLCTGNSARSIIAESVLNRLGAGHFHAFSAGSHPAGQVNAHALRLLEQAGYPTGELRSKSWDEFERPGAPQMDFIFTVCDNAANEACPVWPGHPVSAHWGLADPAAAPGSPAEKQAAFVETYRTLLDRIGAFVRLPFDALDGENLRQRLADIGSRPAEPAATTGMER